MKPEYHVHIVTVGFEPEPSMDVSGCGMMADKIYLLNDPSDERAVESAKIIANHLGSGNAELKNIEIDCYDFHLIYDTVIKIAEEETKTHGNVKFHINFSRGTAIAVSAVCCAAFELNSQLYYVKYKKGEPQLPLEERIIPIDIENVHDQVILTKGTERIFLMFKGKQKISNQELLQLSGIQSKGSLSRYTSSLEEKGLIESFDNGKKKMWTLTRKGNKILKRLELSNSANSIG